MQSCSSSEEFSANIDALGKVDSSGMIGVCKVVDWLAIGSGVRGSSLSGRNRGPLGFVMESVAFGQGCSLQWKWSLCSGSSFHQWSFLTVSYACTFP